MLNYFESGKSKENTEMWTICDVSIELEIDRCFKFRLTRQLSVLFFFASIFFIDLSFWVDYFFKVFGLIFFFVLSINCLGTFSWIELMHWKCVWIENGKCLSIAFVKSKFISPKAKYSSNDWFRRKRNGNPMEQFVDAIAIAP